jgi:hypothetical protein
VHVIMFVRIRWASILFYAWTPRTMVLGFEYYTLVVHRIGEELQSDLTNVYNMYSI